MPVSTTYVALLRSINVGRRRLPMADLRALCTAAGYEDVRTYVQSGNVVCRSALDAVSFGSDLEARLAEHCGFEVPVVVRTAEEMCDVVRRCPYDTTVDPTKLVVSFAAATIGLDDLGALDPGAFGEETFHLDGREIYLWLPDGQGRSELVIAVARTRAGKSTTARNWRSVTTLTDWAVAAGD